MVNTKLLESLQRSKWQDNPWDHFIIENILTDEQVAEIRGATVERGGVLHDGTRSGYKEGVEKQFEQQTEQKLLNDVTESLINETKFDLPKEFLVRWLQNTGEKPLTEEEAAEEYEKSEKGIRYQLIEGALIKVHDLQIQFEELQDFAKGMIKQQMAQYGQLDSSEKDLDDIAARIFSNQEETKRLSDQLMSKKLLDFYKENANLKVKKVNYETFVKEAYGDAQ